MDKKDEKIIEVLKENSKLSSQQISKRTLIPITTVHNRIKKLERKGIISKYSVILDNKKIGKLVSAYVLINVDYRLLRNKKISHKDIIKRLKMYEAIDEASVVSGSIDILIKVRVKDMEELNVFVTEKASNIEGIERTQTMIILNEI